MIFVTGATGNVGRHVVDLLLAEGAEVRALTRDPAGASLPGGVQVVGDDRLAGIRAVFLNPAAVGDRTAALLASARAQGVSRAVLLSSASVRDDVAVQPDPIGERHKVIEDAVEASGLEWTFLRPGEFASNALFQLAPQIRASGDGIVRGPYGRSHMAPIHERDIAAVAVRALLDDGLTGARPALTGPESLTFTDKIRLIGEAIGRPLRFEELTPEQGRAAMTQAGIPAPVADVLLRYQAEGVDRPAPISPAVREITGRPGLTFAQWAADHAGAFA